MRKWIILGGVVVVLIVALVVIGLSNLGPVIKKAVNTYGPKITKTDVRLADVKISIFSGEAHLQDFYLGNPKGFKSPAAMKVGSVGVDVDEGSLTKETIIIDKIEVVSPEISYEKGHGTDNFRTILDNVKKAVGTGEPSKQEPKKAGEGKKIVINDFILRGGKVNLAVSGLVERSVSAALPDIRLKDVGKKKGGVSAAEAFEQIFAALHEKIISPVVAQALKEQLKGLGLDIDLMGGQTRKELEVGGEGAKKELEAVTEQVKGLLGK